MIELSAQERAEVAACVAAGYSARCNDIGHDANPHLSAFFNAQPEYTRERGLDTLRLAAWWHGWEEANQGLADPDSVEGNA